MSKLTRIVTTNRCFFITIVTFDRIPILVESAHLLRPAIGSAMSKLVARELAWVLLPDHYHGIIQTGNASISTVVQCFKMSFASHYRLATGMRSGRIWQNRFWDYVIRDTADMNRHLDYIHYNPIKHGYALAPAEYLWSSYKSFGRTGNYPPDWGTEAPQFAGTEFGE